MPAWEAAPKYRVRCFIHPSQHFSDLSKLYAGFCELAKQKLISLTFDSPPANSSYAVDEVTLWTEVTDNETGRQQRIAFEQYDRSDRFAGDALRHCDVYFKRSFYRPDIETVLDPACREKVVPFGLNYPCRTMESTIQVARAVLQRAISVVPRSITAILRSPRGLRRKVHDLRVFIASPSISTFEQLPEHPVDKGIVFQSRIWTKSELSDESENEINAPRIELTYALREAFGARFQGGIVRKRAAPQSCPPECLAKERTRRPLYISWSKRAMIGVYTRGLHHSIGFKVAEYLASSKCIVAERMRNELPTALCPGVNYLEFSSPRECVECCRELLTNDELSSQMRKNNWEYYQREVRPDQHVARCLDRAFAHRAGELLSTSRLDAGTASSARVTGPLRTGSPPPDRASP